MEPWSLLGLAKAGFDGFRQIQQLQADGCASVPAKPGVYMVVRPSNADPTFLPKSVGGRFKRNVPTVPLGELVSNWVPGAAILYIGKAGGLDSSATLRTRLGQYMSFGLGKPIGHWGGRYIWQLADHPTLQVCWRHLTEQEPVTVEVSLIDEFRARYGSRPFANLRG